MPDRTGRPPRPAACRANCRRRTPIPRSVSPYGSSRGSTGRANDQRCTLVSSGRGQAEQAAQRVRHDRLSPARVLQMRRRPRSLVEWVTSTGAPSPRREPSSATQLKMVSSETKAPSKSQRPGLEGGGQSQHRLVVPDEQVTLGARSPSSSRRACGSGIASTTASGRVAVHHQLPVVGDLGDGAVRRSRPDRRRGPRPGIANHVGRPSASARRWWSDRRPRAPRRCRSRGGPGPGLANRPPPPGTPGRTP